MSSSYCGYRINGNRSTGYTASPVNGSGGQLKQRKTLTEIKQAIDKRIRIASQPACVPLLRKALAESGFFAHGQIFNDRRTDGTRRLKIWVADRINASPEAWQRRLESHIKAQFGDRYIGGYFLARPAWQGNGASLCIVLSS